MGFSNRSWRKSGVLVIPSLLIVTLVATLALTAGGIFVPGAMAAVPLGVPQSTSLVISQIYGGGGNASAPWQNDFIEIFNPSAVGVSVTGWSVQYASAVGSTWAVTNLNGIIPAGGYYLVREAAGAGCSGSPCGSPLPAPDAIGTLAMSASSGKVALVNTTTALPCGVSCHNAASVVDFVGFGAANDFEGTGPTGTLSNTTGAARNGAGCTDTDNNSADFTVTSGINPRNSSTAPNPCGSSTPTDTPTYTPTPSGPTGTPTDTWTAGPPTNTSTSTSTPVVGSPVLVYMLSYNSYFGTSDEAIRLVNTGSVPMSVGGWQIADTTGAITLPAGATIPASSKIWIANQATTFRSLFGISPDFEYGADSDPLVPQAAATAGFNFPNNGDAVFLKDGSLSTVDTLVYKAGNVAATGWSGASVQPFLPSGQPDFTEPGQIFYRKLDELTGMPVADTNTKDDWAQDDDPTGSTPTPGREHDDVTAKKLLRPGWALTDPALEDMFFTKQYTDTNVTSKFLVSPDNSYGAVRDLIISATQSITIETYEWHHSGLVQDIIDAKNRGVQIAVTIDGNPCCLAPPRPDDETLWSAKQWENAGIPVYFFSGDPTTPDDNYRWNNVHAKIMVVDNQWVFTGSDNFSYSSMPSDPKGNGTAGERGALIITNAPDVVAYTSRLVNNDTDTSKYADLVRYPALGTPPPSFTPPPADDMTGYNVVKPTPLVVTETESFEIIQAPDNALRESDSLIGMVNKAGSGDEVMVEQQYERKYWETSVTDGPNPRLEAYIAAARRGANVRILLDGFFEGADCSSATHNPATVAYVNGLGLPNLQAKVGEPALGGPVGSGSPTTGNIHNKMVLVKAGPQGYAHLTSINGSLNSSKNNREYGVQVASNAAYDYYKDVFDYDWSVGFLPCGPTPTATATTTGTQTPFTATPTATGVPTLPCNSLVNSDFETGNLAPWSTTTAGVTAAVDSSVEHSGLYSVAVTHAFTSTGGGSQGIQQDVSGIVAGQAYPLQGYVYRPDNNIQSARVRVAWYACADFSCSQLSTSDVFAGNRGVAGWQYFSGTVTAPAGAVAARYRLLFYNANPVNSTIYYDDVELACSLATSTPTVTSIPTATEAATATPTEPPPVQLIGHVTYQGISQPNARNVQALTLTLCIGGTPQDFVQNTDDQGFFTATLATGPGSYNYIVKPYKDLANAGAVSLASGTNNLEFGTLRAGDTDNNNLVNTTDFNRVKSAFGTASNPFADFNNDGITNTTDFNLMRNNFGTAGQSLTCP